MRDCSNDIFDEWQSSVFGDGTWPIYSSLWPCSGGEYRISSNIVHSGEHALEMRMGQRQSVVENLTIPSRRTLHNEPAQIDRPVYSLKPPCGIKQNAPPINYSTLPEPWMVVGAVQQAELFIVVKFREGDRLRLSVYLANETSSVLVGLILARYRLMGLVDASGHGTIQFIEENFLFYNITAAPTGLSTEGEIACPLGKFDCFATDKLSWRNQTIKCEMGPAQEHYRTTFAIANQPVRQWITIERDLMRDVLAAGWNNTAEMGYPFGGPFIHLAASATNTTQYVDDVALIVSSVPFCPPEVPMTAIPPITSPEPPLKLALERQSANITLRHMEWLLNAESSVAQIPVTVHTLRSSQVELAVEDCPAGWVCHFDPASLIVSTRNTSTLKVTAAPDTPNGAYTLTVTATTRSEDEDSFTTRGTAHIQVEHQYDKTPSTSTDFQILGLTDVRFIVPVVLIIIIVTVILVRAARSRGQSRRQDTARQHRRNIER
jgi:hypothetical protein